MQPVLTSWQYLLTQQTWQEIRWEAVFPVVKLASIFSEAVLFRPGPAVFTGSGQPGQSGVDGRLRPWCFWLLWTAINICNKSVLICLFIQETRYYANTNSTSPLYGNFSSNLA